MNNDTDKTAYSRKNPIFASSFGALAFLAMLALLSYFGYKLGDIEDQLESRLEYQPPVATLTETDATQPLFATRHAHTIYVPVYSHIYAMGGTPVLLETTLSVRNTDPEKPVVITSIAYFDTKGNMVEEYIDGNLMLGPLESTEVLVEKRDIRGGSGANFLVKWNAKTPVHLPIVQAVMVGSEGDLDISFRSDGRPLTTRIDPISMDK
ncbi:MAG: DUF3124 domain-containing protein [Thiotrichales bacterium]|nr:MAG: DUF3124 domain-containing protein [Thiotrichales bacterium]